MPGWRRVALGGPVLYRCCRWKPVHAVLGMWPQTGIFKEYYKWDSVGMEQVIDLQPNYDKMHGNHAFWLRPHSGSNEREKDITWENAVAFTINENWRVVKSETSYKLRSNLPCWHRTPARFFIILFLIRRSYLHFSIVQAFFYTIYTDAIKFVRSFFHIVSLLCRKSG